MRIFRIFGVARPVSKALYVCACLGMSLFIATAVQAANFSSTQNGPWDDPNTWGGGGFPVAGDSAEINSGHTITVNGSQAVSNLQVDGGGVLGLSSGASLSVSGPLVTMLGTVNGAGTFQTQGTVTLDNRGSFSAPLSVTSGTTTVKNGSSGTTTFNGAITVAGGATLDTVQSNNSWTVIANGDVNVNSGGTLSGLNVFNFAGITFTNNGNVSVVFTGFTRNSSQSIAGTGTWTGGTIAIGDPDNTINSTTSLANAMTFAVSTVNVNNGDTLSVTSPLTINGSNFNNTSGGTLSLVAALTYDGGVTPGKVFSNFSGGTVSGAGALQTQGIVTLDNRGSFSAPLSVTSGTTTVKNGSSGTTTFNGAITVAGGATLDTVQSNNSWTVIANGDVNVNSGGTLSGLNVFNFAGITFTNNGNVSVVFTGFTRNSSQSIAGTGTWTGGTIAIGDPDNTNNSNTSLANAMTFAVSAVNVNNGDTLSVTSPLTINGSNINNTAGGTLSLSAALTWNGGTTPGKLLTNANSGTITGSGAFQTQGIVTLDNRGSFSAPLSVTSGTTTVENLSSGTTTFNGAITVAGGATLDTVQSNNAWNVNANGNVTLDVGSTLSGLNVFNFAGITFTNNGNVSVVFTGFTRNSSQSIAGTGTWTGGTIAIGDPDNTNNSNTSLANAMTFAVSAVNVNNGDTLSVTSPLTINGSNINNTAGGTLSLSAALTWNGGTTPGKLLTNANSGTITGSGAFQTQGIVTLDNRGSFSAPLSVTSGTTTVENLSSGTTTFNGAITVAGGATLDTVQSNNAWNVNANGNVTLDVGSTLSGLNAFNFAGITFTNNGNVSVVSLQFARVSSQMLMGSGAFVSNTATVLSGSTVSLGSNHQMSTVVINGGGVFDITSRTLGLSGNGTPLVNNGSLATTGSTIVYNGAAAQNVGTTNINYNNLTIDNTAGVSLPAAESVPSTLALINGVFSIGSNLTMGDGALIRRSDGSLSGTPNFGSSVSVEYFGSNPLTTGSELPATASVLNNLTINNTAGVTLSNSVQVNGLLTLNADLATSANTLVMSGTASSSGFFDVIGSVERIGIPVGVGVSFGNPNNVITINFGATPPNDITVNLVKVAQSGSGLPQPSVMRTYTITANNGSAYNARLRLHYRDTELNGNAEPTLQLFEQITGTWINKGKGAQLDDGPNEQNWVERNNVTQFSPWTIASAAPTASDGIVTGRIVDNEGNPVEGAVVRLQGTQNRKFITDANGFYRFENVETGGFYTVTPSRVNYQFSPTVRSINLVGETTEAAFGATRVDGNFLNPLDTPEYFVRQHYIDFLGREPDEAGFNFWSDQIIGCGNDEPCISRKRENVSAAYFLSIEFQRTGGLVDGLYRASYGARPEFAQFMPDTRAVGLGVRVGEEGWEAKLAANKEAFLNAFVNRPAFHATYDGMDASTFVDALISHTNVSFTSAERDELANGLATGTMTRAEVLGSIAENNRFVNAKFNETFVMMEYFGYLRRNADADGFAFWLNKLNQFGGNFEQAEMVKAFIVAGEYRDRFPR